MSYMPLPASVPGVPLGLEYLTALDQLLIQRQVEALEVLTPWETSNKYQIRNSLGQPVYFAAEESDVCMRQCCGAERGFILHIFDNFQREVIRVTRSFKCCGGCCWCASANCDACAFEIQVEAPVGQVCGYFRQAQSCWLPRFMALDANRQDVFYVEGPCLIFDSVCCTADQKFQIYSADRTTEIGCISKQWGGVGAEMFTTATKFHVNFPIDLDVRIKAVLLSAVFLVGFMYFETKKDR